MNLNHLVLKFTSITTLYVFESKSYNESWTMTLVNIQASTSQFALYTLYLDVKDCLYGCNYGFRAIILHTFGV